MNDFLRRKEMKFGELPKYGTQTRLVTGSEGETNKENTRYSIKKLLEVNKNRTCFGGNAAWYLREKCIQINQIRYH